MVGNYFGRQRSCTPGVGRDRSTHGGNLQGTTDEIDGFEKLCIHDTHENGRKYLAVSMMYNGEQRPRARSSHRHSRGWYSEGTSRSADGGSHPPIGREKPHK